MKSVQVRLFGAFKNDVPAGEIVIEVTETLKASELMEAVSLRLREVVRGFSNQELLMNSVLADENGVFSDDDVIAVGSSVALLPPVCGG